MFESSPTKEPFSQIKKSFLHFPDHPVKFQYKQVSGNIQGEKKDKIPAKKTEIENTIVSNKEPTFLIILILFYYNQFHLYDFCYAI